MHSEVTTDLSKIESNLKRCRFDGDNVVLISTGSMNPIHRSHISNMVKTKQYLENNYNYNVLGGFISPTHDQYVRKKLSNELISGQHRIEMCQKAIEEENETDWLAVDKAECMASTFIKLSEVTANLQDFLNKKFQLSKPIRVIYVAGLDLFNRCNGMYSLRKAHIGGVAVVYRGGENKSLVQSCINQNAPRLYFIQIEDHFNDISSTLIRQKLKLNENCSHLTYTSVLDYLQFKQTKN